MRKNYCAKFTKRFFSFCLTARVPWVGYSNNALKRIKIRLHTVLCVVSLLMNEIKIEYPCAGATYNRPEYGVYSYGVYPRSSVLAGQTRRIFLDSFPTLEEAREAYPDAEFTNRSNYQAPYLNHLPDDGDY